MHNSIITAIAWQPGVLQSIEIILALKLVKGNIVEIENRRQLEKQARIDSIKKSAWNIFLRDGFDSAKIADIAKDCLLGLSTLYYYFKDKRQIVYSLMLDFKVDINQALMELLGSEVTYREFVKGYIDVNLQDIEKFRFFVFADNFYNYHSQYDVSDPVLDEYDRITNRHGQYLVSCLVPDHDHETAVKVKVALRMILGSLRRYVLTPQKSWPSTPEEKDEMLETLKDISCSLFSTIGFDIDAPVAAPDTATAPDTAAAPDTAQE